MSRAPPASGLGGADGLRCAERVRPARLFLPDSARGSSCRRTPRSLPREAKFLRIMALSWGFMGAQFALTGVFRASGNMVISMMVTIVSQWVLQFPLAYVLSRHTSLGAEGLYWSVPVTNVLITLLTAGIYLHGGWRKKRLLDVEESDRTVGGDPDRRRRTIRLPAPTARVCSATNRGHSPCPAARAYPCKLARAGPPAAIGVALAEIA